MRENHPPGNIGLSDWLLPTPKLTYPEASSSTATCMSLPLSAEVSLCPRWLHLGLGELRKSFLCFLHDLWGSEPLFTLGHTHQST